MDKEKIKLELKEILKNDLEIVVSDDEFDMDLVSVGVNSLTFVKLLVCLESYFDISFYIDYITISRLYNLNQIVEHVNELICEREVGKDDVYTRSDEMYL